MKKLMITTIAAAMVLCLSAVSVAQGPARSAAPGAAHGMGMRRGPNPEFLARAKKMNDEIMAKLHLTKAQEKKIQALTKRTMSQQKAVLAEGRKGGDQHGLRSRFMAINKQRQDGLKKILTVDQFKKYEALRKEAMEKVRAQFRKQGGPQRGAGPAPRGPHVR
jgi:Spy/CpxP family protein refolding chaperone